MDYKDVCLACLVTLAAINMVLNLRFHRRRRKLRQAWYVPADGRQVARLYFLSINAKFRTDFAVSSLLTYVIYFKQARQDV